MKHADACGRQIEPDNFGGVQPETGRAAPCVAITAGAEAGEKTSETVIQKIFDELPVP